LTKYILDTDHLSLIQRKGKEGQLILAKISTLDNPEIAVTVITYEEQIRGRLLYLAKAKSIEEQVKAYSGLQQLITDYRSIPIIAYDRPAILEYERLRKQYSRLGKMDLKIAAITLTSDGILLTRNEGDFAQIAELKWEDWSKIVST
jgi:tRNA(fMet)-specific endonuclease VapC